MTTYYIEKDGSIVLHDDDRQRLVNTLAFMPEFSESDIQQTDGYVVDDIIKTPEEYTVIKAEEIAEQELQQKKSERAEAVSRITVEVDGMVFDGDEKAQERMSRAVSTARARADRLYNKAVAEWLADQPEGTFVDASQSGIVKDDYMTYETTWVLADSTYTTVTISQLSEACELAGQTQTELWIKPYEEK